MATLAATVFLVFAGGMVTSTGSGLAVPDWPLSYGTLFPPMVGGIFYEHGHRLVAGTVALLTAGLALLAWRVEPRRWVRRIALGAMATVLVQAGLGGLTVIFLLPVAVSVAHTAVANLFFCSIVALALVTGPGWRNAQPATQRPGAGRLWLFTTVTVYVQVLLGALMRHSGAGLAIPDFPLAFGRLLPPFTTWPVMIHFAHRVGALAVLLTAAVAIVGTHRRHGDTVAMTPPAVSLALLLPVQVLLGALTIWSAKNPLLTSVHVVVGTTVLGVCLWATLVAFRAAGHAQPGQQILSPHAPLPQRAT